MTADIIQRWGQAQQSFARGDWVGAIDACAEVSKSAPRFPGAHWMMSRCLQALGEFRQAVAHARQSARVLSSDSTFEERLLVSRGLISAGEYRAAINVIATIRGEDPQAIRVAEGVAEQLMMLDDPVRALEWIEIAERARRSTASLWYMQGNAFKYLGNFARSAEAYEEAIVLNPADGFAHLALATLGLSEGAGQRISRLRRQIAAASGARRDQAAMGFALFRELDLVGDFDTAWDALDGALKIKHADVSQDAMREDRIFDQAIACMRGPAADAGRVQSGFTPVFILGMPRTGTTLVERMLGNHPDVCAGGELSELRMAYKWCTDHYCPAFLDAAAASKMAGVDVDLLGKVYLQNVGWRTRGRRWLTDKHPGNTIFAGLIMRALPTAKIIMLERDPLETCFGNLKELFAAGYYEYSYSQADVANHYRNHARLVRQLTAMADGRVLTVNYEGMVHDPVGTALRIQNHCGLKPEMGVEQVANNNAPVSTASTVQVRRPINVDRIQASKPYRPYLGELHELLERA